MSIGTEQVKSEQDNLPLLNKEELVKRLLFQEKKALALESALDSVLKKYAILIEVRDLRGLCYEVMTLSLQYWEHLTNKTKLDLVSESGIRKIQNDNGTMRTRGFDKYLKIFSVPKRPNITKVFATGKFVLDYSVVSDVFTKKKHDEIQAKLNQLIGC